LIQSARSVSWAPQRHLAREKTVASTQQSPFAPASLPHVPAIDGVRLATAAAGIRYQNRTDLMLAMLEEGTVAAGVTTRSTTCSAPVLWCREQLKHGRARALVVNAGNANAFTGRKGRDAVRMTAEFAAKAVGCTPEEVYVASTGVIGEPLDASRFAHHLGDLARTAAAGAWEEAARAILTTDTFPKLAVRRATIGEVNVTLAGFCKGAGMIAPDMATMLCFLFTDAAIAQPVLQRSWRTAPTAPSTASPSTAIPRRAIPCCCSPPGRRPSAVRRRSRMRPIATSKDSPRRSTA
jgi:glutamate N-acetyltransferase/amino-acid N-acetyltransferase